LTNLKSFTYTDQSQGEAWRKLHHATLKVKVFHHDLRRPMEVYINVGSAATKAEAQHGLLTHMISCEPLLKISAKKRDESK